MGARGRAIAPFPVPAQPTLDELVVADEPDAWAAVGFAVQDGECQVSSVTIRLGGRAAGHGLVGWSLRGVDPHADLDGLPLPSRVGVSRPAAPAHPNGVVAIDHLVALTPDRARTVARLEAAGFALRRVRDEPSPGGAGGQAFFRLGEVILEVIQYAPATPAGADADGPARLWGLAFTVGSLDRCAAVLGQRLGEPREAVQPGRRIATLRRSAGISLPVAFMTLGRGAL